MTYIVLGIGTVLHWSAVGFILMLIIFGMAARKNNDGAVSDAQRKRYSRVISVSSLTSVISTIVLFFLAVTDSQYYSHWWLVLPVAINLMCVSLALTPTEDDSDKPEN